MEKDKRNKTVKTADLILIGGLIGIALLCLAVLLFSRSDGAFAAVYVDGDEVGRYPLGEDALIELEGFGGGHNTLVISGGCADVTDADCPDRLCVNSRPIRYDGESIICLPHRLTVTIEGGEDSGVDLP